MTIFRGLKVLDVGTWIAGPVAATMLADYGADVIKVERPGRGDDYRRFASFAISPNAEANYTWLLDAHNKRSLSLNLKSEEGRRILLELAAQADVYITNQPPAMRLELGLTYDDLKACNPRLIYASLTGYGESGPERDREAFDLVAYWARSGLMDLVRAPGADPAQCLPGMGDHPTAMALYAGIVTALLDRERTGKGSMVHTSLLANGVWAASCIAQARFCGAATAGYQDVHRHFWNRPLYCAADGRWLQFTMVRTDAEFKQVLQGLEIEDLSDDARFATSESRITHGEALTERLRARIAAEPSGYWMARFAETGAPAALVGQVDDLANDSQIAASGLLSPPSDAADGAQFIRPPVNVDGLDPAPIGKAPELGEHSAEVLAELGYGDADIARLAAQGVI